MNNFYLQDSRQYVGNCVLWWAKDGGYTTDLSKAHIFSREEAQALHNARQSDIPWPKEYIDNKVRPSVDMQYINRNEALADSGVIIKQPQKTKDRLHFNCAGCGRFIAESERFTKNCDNCDTDNRP